MKVKLLAHTPEPEKLIAAAAKNCYSSSNIDNVLEGLTEEKTENFVNMLSEIGHESPIEHVSFTFAIEGVSRSLLAQITRHRMASFSVQSQRYVREKGFEYVLPPEIDKIPAAREKFIQAMEDDQRTYEELTAALMEGYLKELLEQGIPEKAARSRAEKHAIEDARYVLPNACATRIVMTANARSLKNFFRLRCCNRAQWHCPNCGALVQGIKNGDGIAKGECRSCGSSMVRKFMGRRHDRLDVYAPKGQESVYA